MKECFFDRVITTITQSTWAGIIVPSLAVANFYAQYVPDSVVFLPHAYDSFESYTKSWHKSSWFLLQRFFLFFHSYNVDSGDQRQHALWTKYFCFLHEYKEFYQKYPPCLEKNMHFISEKWFVYNAFWSEYVQSNTNECHTSCFIYTAYTAYNTLRTCGPVCVIAHHNDMLRCFEQDYCLQPQNVCDVTELYPTTRHDLHPCAQRIKIESWAKNPEKKRIAFFCEKLLPYPIMSSQQYLWQIVYDFLVLILQSRSYRVEMMFWKHPLMAYIIPSLRSSLAKHVTYSLWKKRYRFFSAYVIRFIKPLLNKNISFFEWCELCIAILEKLITQHDRITFIFIKEFMIEVRNVHAVFHQRKENAYLKICDKILECSFWAIMPEDWGVLLAYEHVLTVSLDTLYVVGSTSTDSLHDTIQKNSLYDKRHASNTVLCGLDMLSLSEKQENKTEKIIQYTPLSLNRISVTDIQRYLTSPNDFYTHSLLRLQGPSSWVQQWGINMHAMLAAWLTLCPPEKKDCVSTLRNTLHKTWEIYLGKFESSLHQEICEYLLSAECARRGQYTYRTLCEIKGEYVFHHNERSITCVARADRIDIMEDGSVHIIDYKTGIVPSMRDVETAKSIQLPVEMILWNKGAFGDKKNTNVTALILWKIPFLGPNIIKTFTPIEKSLTETYEKKLNQWLYDFLCGHYG